MNPCLSINPYNGFLASVVGDLPRWLDLGADPNYVIPEVGLTPMACACREDDIESVRLLLGRGANPNFNMPICCARSVEVARLLVEYGADVKVRSSYGNTLLHVACIYNNDALAEFYLQQGLTLDETNEFGQTAVHFACMRLVSVPQNVPLQPITNRQPSLMLDAKLPPAHQEARAIIRTFSLENKRENLPKMDSGAPRELNLPLLKLFSDCGDDFKLPDRLGFSPMAYAISSGWKSEMEKFFTGKKYFDHEVFQALRSGERQVVMDYLDLEGDPNIIERCETLVHMAANHGDCPVLSKLISCGALIDERLTPRACSEDALYGMTPLFSVCHLMNSSTRQLTMEMLIAAGAKVNTPCDGYFTPFLRLCEVGHAPAIRRMIQGAYDQLMSVQIIPDQPVTKPGHLQPMSRDEVGNKALTMLCKMYSADENAVETFTAEHEAAITGYQQAQHNRKEALALFEQECKNTAAGDQAIDAALKNYLESSKHCQQARSVMIQAGDDVIQLIEFHQSAEYKTSHRQLGDIIQRLRNEMAPVDVFVK